MSNKYGIRKETNLFQFSMFLCVSVGIVFMSQYTVCSDNLVSPYKGLCSIIHCMEFLIDWINVLKNWKCQFFYCNIFQYPIIKSFPKRCFYNGHWQTNDKWLINELWNGEKIESIHDILAFWCWDLYANLQTTSFIYIDLIFL